ncbi:MAG: hypothetical protein PHI27_13795, partial [Eubacteriales bacterium]|nr:hypothetical protein [Eubacteriales bacterium]
KPEITVKVSLLPLKGSPLWKWYGELERFALGDGVLFHHSAINADIALRMEERTYDVLRGENTQVTLGSAKQTLAFTLAGISGAVATVKRVTNEKGNLRSERLEGAINALKNQLLASAGYASPTVNSKKGLLFENTMAGSGFGALYLGPGIFSIANEKNADGSWSWRTFGTGGGFTADEITAGLISADRINASELAADSGFVGELVTSLIASPLGKSLNLASNTAITAIVGDISSLSFRVVVTPSKTILSSDADEITLTATVFDVGGDITADLDAESFTWTRLSGDTASDETWNAENHTGKTLTIGASAVERYATYTCTVETA